jgi:hypothetical protein
LIGPHQVATIDNKCAYVHIGEQFGPRACNVTQLKSAITQQSQNPENSIIFVPTPWPTRFTEVMAAGDDREALFDDAKRAELLSLIDRGTFRLVVTDDPVDKPNVVPSRFVLAIKTKDEKDVLKARVVLGGHRDRDKNKLVRSNASLIQSFVRLLLATAATMGFDSYLQMSSKLTSRAPAISSARCS